MAAVWEGPAATYELRVAPEPDARAAAVAGHAAGQMHTDGTQLVQPEPLLPPTAAAPLALVVGLLLLPPQPAAVLLLAHCPAAATRCQPAPLTPCHLWNQSLCSGPHSPATGPETAGVGSAARGLADQQEPQEQQE